MAPHPAPGPRAGEADETGAHQRPRVPFRRLDMAENAG